MKSPDFIFPDFKVVDIHLHFPIEQDDYFKPYRDRYISENGIEKWNKLEILADSIPSWLPSFGFDYPEKLSSDYHMVAKRWYQEVIDNDIEKVVFLTGGTNEILSEVCNTYSDKFVGFAFNDPTEIDADKKLYDAITKLNLKGYKILAPLYNIPLTDKKFEKVFEVCNRLKLTVIIHFGILGGANGIVYGPNMSCLILGEIAKKYPEATFVVPHFGCGYTNELLSVCWACPNVYVDTSGNNLWTKWTMESYTLEQLFYKFNETIGASRILFGTDSEWFPRGYVNRYLSDQYRACLNINMDKSDIKLIFRENTKRLLQI